MHRSIKKIRCFEYEKIRIRTNVARSIDERWFFFKWFLFIAIKMFSNWVAKLSRRYWELTRMNFTNSQYWSYAMKWSHSSEWICWICCKHEAHNDKISSDGIWIRHLSKATIWWSTAKNHVSQKIADVSCQRIDERRRWTDDCEETAERSEDRATKRV